MRIRIVNNPQLRLLTLEQVQEIVDNIVVDKPCGVRDTYWGPTAPSDTSVPWQPTDGCCNPVGQVKFFKNGAWTT